MRCKAARRTVVGVRTRPTVFRFKNFSTEFFFGIFSLIQQITDIRLHTCCKAIRIANKAQDRAPKTGLKSDIHCMCMPLFHHPIIAIDRMPCQCFKRAADSGTLWKAWFFREKDQLNSKMPVISINRPMVIILLSHHTSFRKMQHLELSFMLLYIVLAPIKHDASAVCSTMRGLSFKFGQHIKQIQSIVQLISSLTATGIIVNTSS